MTQRQRIIEYLKSKGKITSYTAALHLDVYNLSARVNELRCKGYDIGSRTVQVTNRYGKAIKIKEYYLKGDKENV